MGDDNTRLNALARNVGAGKLGAIVSLDRNDEIGDLAKAFSNMQTQLFTDRLTGTANREAIVPRIEDRIIHQRRSGDNHPFAVRFIDLNLETAVDRLQPLARPHEC